MTRRIMNKKVLKLRDEIEKVNKSKALGYEETMDFNWGWLSALFLKKIITKKEYNDLKKVYSNFKNGDSYWFINDKGELEVDTEGEITDEDYN